MSGKLKNTFRLQQNVSLSPLGRKDQPRRVLWKSWNFPVERMEVGHSFIAHENYDYGMTIAIKNKCRVLAKRAGVPMSFAVREWNRKIRVWRVK